MAEDGVPGVRQTCLRPLAPSAGRAPEVPAAEWIQETTGRETGRPRPFRGAAPCPE
ncbi:hypothetical protein [Streptosporangium roseum]|uniref:hypothetical protein n=1 Tax=Streptosporangium roseum TaxID=2001 RepID=UPI0018CC1F66|nr:hypothetical protein [Streptosporangium roseum]